MIILYIFVAILLVNIFFCDFLLHENMMADFINNNLNDAILRKRNKYFGKRDLFPNVNTSIIYSEKLMELEFQAKYEKVGLLLNEYNSIKHQNKELLKYYHLLLQCIYVLFTANKIKIYPYIH